MRSDKAGFAVLACSFAIGSVVACGGSNASPPSTPVAPTAAPSQSAASAPAPSASSSETPSDARAQAWAPPDPADGPPTDEVIMKSCGDIVRVFERANLRDAAEARALLKDMEANPPPLPAAQFAWCRDRISELIARKERLEDAARSVQRTPEAEAHNALGQIARDMAAAYERETIAGGAKPAHVLCPSAKPVPAKLDDVTDKPYASKTTEWTNDPGWRCLRFALSEPQAWQLEVKTTAAGFAAYARRKEGARVREMQVRGTVDAGKQMLVVEPKIIDSKPD